MGAAQSKNGSNDCGQWPTEGVPQPQQLMRALCDLSDLVAAKKYGGYAELVFSATTVLRDDAASWDDVHAQLSSIEGARDIWHVDAALQTMNGRLEWCLQQMRHQAQKSRLKPALKEASKAQQVLLLANAAHRQCVHAIAVVVSTKHVEASMWLLDAPDPPAANRLAASDLEAVDATSTAKATAQGPIRKSGVNRAHASTVHPGDTAGPSAMLLDDFNCMQQPKDVAAPMQSPPHAPAPGPSPTAVERATDGHNTVDTNNEAVQTPGFGGWLDSIENARAPSLAVLEAAASLRAGGDALSAREARQLLQEAAAQGCAEACVDLGKMVEAGEGLLLADDREAVAWFGRGAALGSPEALHYLGFALEHGHGVQQDTAAAMECYRCAAAAHWMPSMNNLACLLVRGSDDGVLRPDPWAAFGLLEAAAAAGSCEAWLNLGVCYAEGLLPMGPPPGSRDGSGELGGDAAPAAPAPALSGPNDRVAAAEECFVRSGLPVALLQLGLLQLASGRPSAAQVSFESVVDAEQGTGPLAAEALLQLAQMQEQRGAQLEQLAGMRISSTGRSPWLGGCLEQKRASRNWHKNSSKHEGLWSALSLAAALPGSATAVAPMLQAPVAAARAAAQALYERAALAGSADAQYWMGCLSYSTSSGGQDEQCCADALAWWAQAAQQGHGGSLFAIGAVAERGSDVAQLLVPSGRVAAVACYRAASQCGCKVASERLALLKDRTIAGGKHNRLKSSVIARLVCKLDGSKSSSRRGSSGSNVNHSGYHTRVYS